MECPEENLIVDYLRGDLEASAHDDVEGHFDHCPSCSMVVAELAKIYRDSQAPSAGPEDTLVGTTDEPESPGWSRELRRRPALGQGDVVGRYVILETIGSGGMGVVYSAYDPELDRKVAVKLLLTTPESGSGGPDQQRTRLLREAQTCARLSHPNVITVHDVGTTEGRVFVAMEFISGGTLSQWLKAEPRSWRDVLEVFSAAGRGLAAAHAAGLVHRDFKPDNVLMGSGGRVVVTDFGLARPVGHDPRSTAGASIIRKRRLELGPATETGALVGTPAYMAPEQLAGDRADAASDQFSFCVALHEALYGLRPFAGDTLAELVANVTAGKVRPPPRDVDVPRWLRRALLKGLAVEPSERHPSMQVLLGALSRDPWRRWQRVGMFSLPPAALVVGISAWLHEARPPQPFCEDLESRLVNVWDSRRQEAIEQAFLRSEASYATDAWSRVHQRLDEQVASWLAAQRTVCDAQREATRPQTVITLQMACLQRHLEQMSQVSGLLSEADPAIIEHAVDIVSQLGSPAECDDVDAIARRPAPPSDDENGEPSLASELSRARLLRDAGKPSEAIELATALHDQATSQSDRWHAAEALELRASAYELAGSFDEAEADFHRALSAALAAEHTKVIVQAATGLVWVLVDRGASIDEATRWYEHGMAALGRLGADEELEAALAHAVGTAYLRHRQLDRAEEALSRAHRLSSEHKGARNPSLASLLGTMGQLHVLRNHTQAARSSFERALVLAEEVYGPRHPAVANALDNLAACLGELGDYRAAIALQRRALAIRGPALGDDHPANAATHHNLAMNSAALGQFDKALEHHRQALAIRTARRDGSLEAAESIAAIGRLLRQLGRPGEAVDELRAFLARTSPHAAGLAEVEASLAEALVAADRIDEGLQAFDAARRRTEQASDEPSHAAEILERKAVVLDELGRRDAAGSTLQEALALVRGREGASPLLRARLAFAVAQRIVDEPGDGARQRAVSLAREAAMLCESVPEGASLGLQIAGWLREAEPVERSTDERGSRSVAHATRREQ